jgi:anti-anti-sigma factor
MSDLDDPSRSCPELSCRYQDGTRPARLVISGEIDTATAERFAAALTEAVGRGSGLLVDLRGLTYLGSVGVGVLWRNHEGIATVLVAPGSVVHRVLAYSGFARLCPVIPAG